MHKCRKRDCIYCRDVGSGGAHSSYILCHYMLDTGEKRDCPADKCDKYTPKECVKTIKRGRKVLDL